jgi:hypothetical protein
MPPLRSSAFARKGIFAAHHTVAALGPRAPQSGVQFRWLWRLTSALTLVMQSALARLAFTKALPGVPGDLRAR